MKRRRRYTKGEINALIDAVLHPLIDRSENPRPLEVVDGIMHHINEGDLEESVRKTLAYTVLPKLRQRLLRDMEKQ